MTKDIAKEKSISLALAFISLYKNLLEKKEYVLNKQIIRSETAIGVLLHEAEFAQSKPDFISKISIALKEINETLYWLELLQYGNFITHQEYDQYTLTYKNSCC